MKAPTMLASMIKYDRAILFFFWVYALSGLIAREDYTRFLRPSLAILPLISILIFLLFLIVELMRAGDPRPPMRATGARWMILLSPILFIPIARQTTLGEADFDRRWLGGGTILPLERSDQNVVSSTESGQGDHYNASFSEIYWNPEPFHRRSISVVGMVRKLPQISEIHGPEAGLIYRFIVTCCVADAVPFAILLPEGIPPDVPDGSWIQADGILVVEPTPPSGTMRMENAKAHPVPTPRNPYAF